MAAEDVFFVSCSVPSVQTRGWDQHACAYSRPARAMKNEDEHENENGNEGGNGNENDNGMAAYGSDYDNDNEYEH